MTWAYYLGASYINYLKPVAFRKQEKISVSTPMSDQPSFLSQTSGPLGSMYSSRNAPRSSTSPPMDPPPGSVYRPEMPSSSIHQPRQQVPYGGTSTQPAQPPLAPQTPSFPTPSTQGYPPTNTLGPVTMPVPQMGRGPRSVTESEGRHGTEVDARVPDGERRLKSPGNPPVHHGGRGESNGCCCTVV